MTNRYRCFRLSAAMPLVMLLTACTQIDPLASGDIAAGARSAATVKTEQVLRPGSAAAIEKVVRNAPPPQIAAPADAEAAEVLGWLGIGSGMQVLDLYADGGRYTRVVSELVGETGRVVVHDNTPFVDFARASAPSIEIPLDNVQRLRSTSASLVLPARGFDAALLFMAYREVYYVLGPDGWQRLEDENLLTALYRSLRPGAVLGVIQHRRARQTAESPIAPASSVAASRVRVDLTEAGFVFEDERRFSGSPPDDDTQAETGELSGRLVQRYRRPW